MSKKTDKAIQDAVRAAELRGRDNLELNGEAHRRELELRDVALIEAGFIPISAIRELIVSRESVIHLSDAYRYDDVTRAIIKALWCQ